MHTQANRHHRNKEFEVGNGVYVKLQPYWQSSLTHRLSNKLAKKYYGPYQIAARVGKVAYRLLLPPESRIHPVFHISILKLCPNPAEVISAHPPPTAEPYSIPLYILDQRTIKTNKQRVKQVLVQWSNTTPDEATWENWEPFHATFPHISLEDKAHFHEGGNDTTTAQPIAQARPKRQPKIPFKLQDFVREWWCNRLQHLDTLQDIMLNLLFTIIAIMLCCAVKFVRKNIVLSSLLKKILCCKVCAVNMFCL